MSLRLSCSYSDLALSLLPLSLPMTAMPMLRLCLHLHHLLLLLHRHWRTRCLRRGRYGYLSLLTLLAVPWLSLSTLFLPCPRPRPLSLSLELRLSMVPPSTLMRKLRHHPRPHHAHLYLLLPLRELLKLRMQQHLLLRLSDLLAFGRGGAIWSGSVRVGWAAGRTWIGIGVGVERALAGAWLSRGGVVWVLRWSLARLALTLALILVLTLTLILISPGQLGLTVRNRRRRHTGIRRRPW